MFCQFCGNEIADDSIFCGSCGKRVQKKLAAEQEDSQPPLPPSAQPPAPPPPNQPAAPPPFYEPPASRNIFKRNPALIIVTAVLLAVIGGGIWFFAQGGAGNGKGRADPGGEPVPQQQAPGEQGLEDKADPSGAVPVQPSKEEISEPRAEDFAWLKVDSIDGIIPVSAVPSEYLDILGKWKAVIIGYRGLFAEETESVYMFMEIEKYNPDKHGHWEGVNTAVLFYPLYTTYPYSAEAEPVEGADSQSPASFGYSTLSVTMPHNPQMVYDLFFWEEGGVQYAQYHYHAPEGTDETSYLMALTRVKP